MEQEEAQKNKSFSILWMLGILILAFVLYFFRASEYALLNSLQVIPKSEAFTELYFPSDFSLPAKAVTGMKIPFSFIIHNVEGKDMTYDYHVYLKSSRGFVTTLDEGTLSLKNGELKNVSESFILTSPLIGSTVFVELPGRQQSVHFKLL